MFAEDDRLALSQPVTVRTRKRSRQRRLRMFPALGSPTTSADAAGGRVKITLAPEIWQEVPIAFTRKAASSLRDDERLPAGAKPGCVASVALKTLTNRTPRRRPGRTTHSLSQVRQHHVQVWTKSAVACVSAAAEHLRLVAFSAAGMSPLLTQFTAWDRVQRSYFL